MLKRRIGHHFEVIFYAPSDNEFEPFYEVEVIDANNLTDAVGMVQEVLSGNTVSTEAHIYAMADMGPREFGNHEFEERKVKTAYLLTDDTIEWYDY